MSGILAAAFALLLVQQAAPHPSTQTAYLPPAIRPFEPPSDFGRTAAEGAEAGGAHRRALERPVAVEAYVRSYEFSPADADVAYDQGVTAAEIRADQASSPMDGYWRAAGSDGETLFDLVLIDDGGRVEGGWRAWGRAGTAVLESGDLILEGLGTSRLEADGPGWRGRLIPASGGARPFSLTRQR